MRAGERYFLVAATASAVAGVAELDAQEWAPAAARTEAEGAPLVEARTALLGGG